MGNVKKLTLFQLIGITMAFFGTVRSVPTLAITGWTQISYLLGAVILFAIPISLIAAELATGWPEEGGPQVWVREAFGNKWSFVTSWLLWVQMFFGMVMVASTVGVLISYVINKPELAKNNVYIFLVIVISYWTVTLLNLKYDMVKVVGNIGSLIGVYIPFIALVILGVAYTIKNGINPNGYLGAFSMSKVFPDLGNLHSVSYFTGIIFIFAGVEISSVHANNIDNPKKNYPIAVIGSVILIVIFNLIAGLTVANAVPNGEMELSNITQPFVIYCESLGIPSIFNNLISAMIAIGVLAQLSAWVLGPSKAMIKVAEEGNLPKVFQKRSANGAPITIVLVQAVVISLIAVAYLVTDDVNSAFFMITVTTTILYCIVYILIALSAIRLRYTKGDVERPFRLGAQGNGAMWFTVILTLIGILLTVFVGLIPPEGTPNPTFYVAFQVIGTVVSVAIALIIYACRKPEWIKEK